MFVRKELTFPHKAVLTAAMLRELYDYPRELSRLMFNDFSDGIICGLDFSLKDGELILSSGLVRFGGEIFRLHDDLNLSALAEENFLVADKEYFISAEKSSRKKEPCLTEKNLALTFTEQSPPFSLGKFIFRGRRNFYLPELTDEPFDEIFSRSKLNLFDVPFAAKNAPTFHPLLFRLVKKFLSRKKNRTPFDYALFVHLQNNDTLSIETLAEYISEVNETFDTTDREKFFENFWDCLRKSKFTVVPAELDTDREESSSARTKRRPRLI